MTNHGDVYYVCTVFTKCFYAVHFLVQCGVFVVFLLNLSLEPEWTQNIHRWLYNVHLCTVSYVPGFVPMVDNWCTIHMDTLCTVQGNCVQIVLITVCRIIHWRTWIWPCVQWKVIVYKLLTVCRIIHWRTWIWPMAMGTVQGHCVQIAAINVLPFYLLQ